MTIENTISTLYQIAPAVDTFTNMESFKKLIKRECPNLDLPLIKLAHLIRELEAEQRRQGAKSSGKGNPMKIAERILKRGAKITPALGYAAIIDDNQYICDSFLCVCYGKENHLPLEPMPEDISPMDYEKCFPQAEGEPVELPDLIALKNYIKMKKALTKGIKAKDYKIIYDFGIGRAPFDAQLLAEIIEMLPNAKAEIVNYTLVLKDEQDNKGLLMGLNRAAGGERKKTEI